MLEISCIFRLAFIEDTFIKVVTGGNQEKPEETTILGRGSGELANSASEKEKKQTICKLLSANCEV